MSTTENIDTSVMIKTYYWSNSARGFFVKEVHGDNRPPDCVEITFAEHEEYMMKQSIGFEITPSPGTGKPILVDRRPSPTEAESHNVRIKRNLLLHKYVDSVNQVRWNLLTTEQQAFLTTYRQQLLEVPQQPGFPFDVIWPEEPTFKV
jgi:hypothetical protein